MTWAETRAVAGRRKRHSGNDDGAEDDGDVEGGKDDGGGEHSAHNKGEENGENNKVREDSRGYGCKGDLQRR
jgi:hypothetical protein